MASKRPERLAFALAAVCGVAWLGSLLSQPTRGKDWRGYAGVARLQPSVVYRFTLEAPFDVAPARDMTRTENQSVFRAALEATGARNIAFRTTGHGVAVDFDQSFGEPRQIDFSALAVGTFRPVLARRLDGLDWEAP